LAQKAICVGHSWIRLTTQNKSVGLSSLNHHPCEWNHIVLTNKTTSTLQYTIVKPTFCEKIRHVATIKCQNYIASQLTNAAFIIIQYK